MTSDEAGIFVTAHNVDLSNCDRELIQFPGAIQPHGALLVLNEPELHLLQVSNNVDAFFAIGLEALRHHGLASLLEESPLAILKARLAREKLDAGPVHVLSVRLKTNAEHVHCFAHRVDEALILEFEAVSEQQSCILDLYSELRSCLQQLQATKSLKAFFDLAVQQIQHFSGFERVLAYRFDEDGSGEVIAEAKHAELEPFLGLHYPAVDIPAPARRLFSLTWVRHLPDVNYVPVALTPEKHPNTGKPLDMSYAFLRSVSVMYSDYLKNMGVKATMVLTVLKDGQPWGLISCMHHTTPKHVPYEIRMASEFLAHMLSLLMVAKEDVENYQYQLKLAANLDHLIAQLAVESNLSDGLFRGRVDVLTAFDAHGAALVTDAEITCLGQTPAETEIRELTHWLASHPQQIYHTRHLATDFPAATAYPELASGLLAISLSHTRSRFLLWFRPQALEEVHWAGDPHKPVEVSDETGEIRLKPRSSFAVWKEITHGRSRPWHSCEIRYAHDLRRALIEVIVKKAEEITLINRELAKSNKELDDFAYAASHDLKEPLRGIHNYAQFLVASEHEHLSDEGKRRIDTILRLTRRMDELIESLLYYSKVGRTDLVMAPTDLNAVISQCIEVLRERIAQSNGTVEVPRPLPTVYCSPVLVAEVFSNLITNSLKYNDTTSRLIEIGYEDKVPPVFYVRDNGIGIDPEHFDQIFQIFRRLHARTAYGGGTGAGLTIVRKIVERHGGKIWLDSTPGQGTTFYFTLDSDGS